MTKYNREVVNRIDTGMTTHRINPEYQYRIEEIMATDEQLGAITRSVFANCGAVMESMVVNEYLSDTAKRIWINDLIRWCGAERFWFSMLEAHTEISPGCMKRLLLAKAEKYLHAIDEGTTQSLKPEIDASRKAQREKISIKGKKKRDVETMY